MILVDNKYVEDIIEYYSNYSVSLNVIKTTQHDNVYYEVVYQYFKLVSNNHYGPILNIFPIDNPEYLHLYKEITPENRYKLYQELKRIYERTEYLKRKLSFIPKAELDERLEEFEVIKDNKIDMISLNSLYDFYNQKFIYS